MVDLGESEPWTPREAFAPLIWGPQTPGEGNTYVGPGSGMAQLPGKWNPGVFYVLAGKVTEWL